MNSPTAPPQQQQQCDVEEQLRTALSDLASLKRVDHKLSISQANDLQRILSLLLPRLITRVGTNHANQQRLNKAETQTTETTTNRLKATYEEIHLKLVSMLSHITKRVRSDPHCQLPCSAILLLLLDKGNDSDDATTLRIKPRVDPFTMNLTLSFLTMGVPRLSLPEAEPLLPGLLVLLGSYCCGLPSVASAARKMQCRQIIHLLLRLFQRIAQEEARGSPRNTTTTTATAIATPPSSKENTAQVPSHSGSSSNNSSVDVMNVARKLVSENATIGQSLYDLILDGLLYQRPPASASPTIPPPGLSQAGHDRLRTGPSPTEQDWAAEMALSRNLSAFKVALLTMIAPTQRFALFDARNDTGDNRKKTATNLGTARAVALMVVASGDLNRDVQSRANILLKAYQDSIRSMATSTAEGKETAEAKEEQEELAADGTTVALLCNLEKLVVGESVADSVLSSCAQKPASLGYHLVGSAQQQQQQQQQQQVLSLKRRMVSDSAATSILSHCSMILDNNVDVLDHPDKSQLIVKLTVFAGSRVVNKAGPSRGLSVARAAPYIAAAKLLGSICARVAAAPDGLLSNGESYLDMMSKALSSALDILKHVSQQRSRGTPSSVSEGGVAIRDACYGIVCSLSRWDPLCRDGRIFGETSTSIDTATLLFGCATNEDDALRPRAVAALDALLLAYCNVLEKGAKSTQQLTANPVPTEPPNPWLAAPAQAAKKVKRSPLSSLEDGMFCRQLISLLWMATQTHQSKSSRLSAAKWTAQLLKPLDLPNACHLLCFLAGDADVTVGNLAKHSLGLDEEMSDEGKPERLPNFTVLTRVLFAEHTQQGRPGYDNFTFKGKGAALRFTLECLFNDMYGDNDEATDVYIRNVSDTLSLFGTAAGGRGPAYGRESISLLEDAANSLCGLITHSAKACSSFQNDTTASFTTNDVVFLALNSNSSKARRKLSETYGRILLDFDLWSDGSNRSFENWVDKSQLAARLSACLERMDSLETRSASINVVHGAVFLAAWCIKALRSALLGFGSASKPDFGTPCWESTSKCLSLLGQGIGNEDETIGHACADAIAIALGYRGSNAPPLEPCLFEGGASLLHNLQNALKTYCNGDKTDPSRSSSLARAAGTVLAASTSGSGCVTDSIQIGPARLLCVDAVFAQIGSMAFRKDSAVALASGEALAHYADAYGPNTKWSGECDAWPEPYDEETYSAMPPHQQVMYRLLYHEIESSSPHRKTAVAPALLALVGRAARVIKDGSVTATRSLTREIVKRIVKIQSAFLRILADPKSKQLVRESCCLGLAACHSIVKYTESLGGTDATGGVSVSDTLNDSLLSAFGQTTNHGGSAMMETRGQNEARLLAENRQTQTTAGSEELAGMAVEVGGTAGLGEAALGAYREMASAAVSLRRPDVLYSLLVLSVSHPVWFTPPYSTRYNACSLLGDDSLVGRAGTSAEIRVLMKPYLSMLLPRLLRARHDPNKQTREQMETLWAGLTGGGAEARQSVTDNLLPIVDYLIENSSNKLWRARVGSCGALAEVLVGRSWIDLGGGNEVVESDEVRVKTTTESTVAGVRVLRLWNVAMRALDDVRLSVRESGEALARSIRALTIRLCDRSIVLKSLETPGLSKTEKQQSADKMSEIAVSTVLPWLTKHGLNQPCAEGVGVCISCLVGVIDVAKPSTIGPILPDLIWSFLMAMSGLEPAALNYLQVQASAGESRTSMSYEQLERLRLQAVQSGPLAKALDKCLRMLPFVDNKTQQAVIPQLDSALRCGAGFATRGAVADTVSSLCSVCPAAFKFSGVSTTNPTVRLLRALYFASERERGQGSKDKMSNALGNLASLAPGQSVRSLALRACERYNNATGNNNDPSARRAAVAALRAIAVRASSQFADGGPRNVWCATVLPIAYLGQREKEQSTSKLCKEVWEEGGSAVSQSGNMKFGVRLEESLLPWIVKAAIVALEDVSWERRRRGASALQELTDLDVLAPTPTTVYSQKPTNSERARRRAQASKQAIDALVGLFSKPRIWDGKSDVVKASVSLACKWALCGADSSEAWIQYGWNSDDADSTCPWAPVDTFGPFHQDCLFAADNFFTDSSTSMNDKFQEMEASQSEETTAVEDQDDTKMDFADADNMIEDEQSAGLDKEAQNETEEQNGSRGPITVTGFARLLLEQGLQQSRKKSLVSSSDEVLPYRASCLSGLAKLFSSLNTTPSDRLSPVSQSLFSIVAKDLLSVVDIGNLLPKETKRRDDTPPLLLARSLDALAAAVWQGFANKNTDGFDNLLLLKVIISAGGPQQGAWTVREAAALASSRLALSFDSACLCRHGMIDAFLQCIRQSLKDRKFWRVRLAGMKLLQSVVSRAGSKEASNVALNSASQVSETAKQQQQILEAILPFKESFVSLARSGLSDSETQVSALATEACSVLSWWP